VSGGFFGGLGVYPAAGRLILEDDDRFGAPPVAVISYAYWQRRFGSSPSAVGQSILVDGTPFTIAGVSPPDFFGVDPGFAPELMIPCMPVHGSLLSRTNIGKGFSTRNSIGSK
jgi:hypothetical protein